MTSRISGFVRLVMGLLVGLALMTSCGGDQGPESEGVGQLRFDLQTTDESGIIFQLRGGFFNIDGPQWPSTYQLVMEDFPPEEAVISLPVASGQYQVELAPGWIMQYSNDGGATFTWITTATTLVSPNPQTVQVLADQVTQVTFQFLVDGNQIDFGPGTLAVGLDVDIVTGPPGWTVQESGTTENLTGVSLIDADTGTAVGVNGTILRTTDDGATWAAQTRLGFIVWTDVAFTDANTGTIVGESAIIERTTDGGATWTIQPDLPGTLVEVLYGVSFIDANTGMVVGDGGAIGRTTDGGATWTRQASGTFETFFAVSLIDANTATAVGSEGTILRTTDGGTTWTAQTSGTTARLTDVSFTDRVRGTVVGAGGIILRTTDGGGG